ncbi:MAG: DUF748 domain-containing protein [Candidatus Abyssubacteria bacterium]
MNILSSFQKLPRIGKIGIVLFSLVLLYALLGFLIAPPILKSVLVSTIKKNLNRDASLEQLRMNPFALSLTARGFQMYNLTGDRFAGFDEFHVNFQLSSPFRRAYTFREIRLVSPEVNIKVLPDGNLDFADILAASGRPAPEPEQKGSLPQVLIFKLSIGQGRVSFQDLSRPAPFERTFFPIQIDLENFSTRRDSESPYAFTARIREDETLDWEGNFSVNPLRSEGRFGLSNIKVRNLWEYFQHQMRFEVTEGSISLAGRYRAYIAGESPGFNLSNCVFTLDNLKLAEKKNGTELISVPALSLRGVEVDYQGRTATIASLESTDARFAAWLASDGTLNYQNLFATGPQGDERAAASVDEKEESAAEDWLVTIKEAAFKNYGVSFEDRTFDKPVQTSLEPINISLKNVSSQKGTKVNVALDLGINESGVISAEGVASPMPLFADLALDISQVALRPFNPYAESFVNLDIMDGALNLQGRLRYKAFDADGPLLRYEGGLTLNNCKAVSRLYSDDFLHWRSLAINDLIVDIQPDRLSISEIVATEPYGKVVIWPDGTVNLSSMLRRKEGTGRGEATAEAGPPMPITIDTIRVVNGSANFADMLIKPRFATGIRDLNGTIKGLSSKSLARADVSLEGKVDEFAPVKIVGQINPLSEDVYTDLEMQFKNIEMTAFTPYSGKFVGRTIQKGKLSVDLKYRVSENVLIGENRIVLDQFTLGERVESPDATDLPVGLALALLRDSNGVIDIDLPVRGDLNDPEFSYGRLVWKALLNLIVKTASSPFALLGGLVGADSGALNFVEFPLGSAELTPGEMEKLNTLAAALTERPMLQLEIKGAADIEYDRDALAEAKLSARLKRAWLEESGSKEEQEDLENISLSEEDYSRLILQTYIETFGKDPKLLLEAQPEESLSDNGASEEAAGPATEPQTSRPAPGRIVLNTGQRVVETFQGLLGLRSESYIKSRAVLREVGHTPESLPVLIEKAKRRLVEDIAIEEFELRLLAQERANRVKGYLIENGGIPDERLYVLDPEMATKSDGSVIRIDLALSAG